MIHFKNNKHVLATFLAFIYIQNLNASTILTANLGSNTVSLINDYNYHLIAEIPVGFKPHEVEVSPNGKLALVSNYGTLKGQIPGSSLSLIDIKNANVVRTIALPEGSRPHGIAFLSNSLAIVTAQGTQSLYILNFITGNILNTIKLPCAGAHMVITDQEKRYAYIGAQSGNVIKIDLLTNTVVDFVNIGEEAEGIALTPDEQLLLATNRKDNQVAVIQPKRLKILKKIQTSFGPVRVAIFNQGQSAIVTNSESGNAQIIDLSSLTITHTFKTTYTHSTINGNKIGGIVPAPNSIVIRDDQMSAYITNLYAGNITLVDLIQGKVMQTFEGGVEPDGLAVT